MPEEQGSHGTGPGIAVLLDYWERIAAWHPRQEKVSDEDLDLQLSSRAFAVPSRGSQENDEQRAVQQRVCHSRVNACFIGIFALLGISLALANAAPNQESSEVATLALLFLLLLIPLGCNRAGAIALASVVLTLLPTVALLATFMQPLPSGQFGLTWTYDAGLSFAGLGALVSALSFRPWIAWCQIGVGIILPLGLLIAFMPHAASLIELDIAGGIISSHWSPRHQELYALYDFLFRPLLLIILLGLIGSWLRRFMFSK